MIGEGEKSEISSGYLKDCFKPLGNAQEISENKVSIYEYNGQKYYGIYAPSGLDDIYIYSVRQKQIMRIILQVFTTDGLLQ